MLVRNRLLHIVNRASVCVCVCVRVSMWVCVSVCVRVYVCSVTAGMINAAQREGAIETDLISPSRVRRSLNVGQLRKWLPVLLVEKSQFG